MNHCPAKPDVLFLGGCSMNQGFKTKVKDVFV